MPNHTIQDALDAVITVQGVGKAYRIFARPRDRLKQLFWPGSVQFNEFWALRDVSFTVKPGEVVGIVGRNGSGKSTLLQIIAGTLTPSTGDVSVRGRVAALLELGSGFNSDFSGRENVFLNGMLLGATREEIAAHLQEIENFAEIGRYFDQPVKTYSSGMVVRLAFATQILLTKDILIVDEALAVGDELFQRKCFGAIERFREQGGTVLFVSHSGETVVQLCDRALLLHCGELVLEDSAKQVMDWYHKLIYAPPEAEERILARIQSLSSGGDTAEPTTSNDVIALSEEKPAISNDVPSVDLAQGSDDFDPHLQSRSALFYEDRGVRFTDFSLRDENDKVVNLLRPRERYYWIYEVEFTEPASRVRFGMTIKTAAGMELGGITSAGMFQGVKRVETGQRVRVRFAFLANLAGGVYFLNGGVAGELEGQEHYLARGVDMAVFRVLDGDQRLLSGGPVDFLVESHVELQGDDFNDVDGGLVIE